jgi:hypothetical protein
MVSVQPISKRSNLLEVEASKLLKGRVSASSTQGAEIIFSF